MPHFNVPMFEFCKVGVDGPVAQKHNESNMNDLNRSSYVGTNNFYSIITMLNCSLDWNKPVVFKLQTNPIDSPIFYMIKVEKTQLM